MMTKIINNSVSETTSIKRLVTKTIGITPYLLMRTFCYGRASSPILTQNRRRSKFENWIGRLFLSGRKSGELKISSGWICGNRPYSNFVSLISIQPVGINATCSTPCLKSLAFKMWAFFYPPQPFPVKHYSYSRKAFTYRPFD